MYGQSGLGLGLARSSPLALAGPWPSYRGLVLPTSGPDPGSLGPVWVGPACGQSKDNTDVGYNFSAAVLLCWYFSLLSISKLAFHTLQMRTLMNFKHSWRRLVEWKFMNWRYGGPLRGEDSCWRRWVLSIYVSAHFKSQSDCKSAVPDYKSCHGVKRFKVISIYVLKRPQLSAWSVCLCRWKFVWLMCNILKLCICSEGLACTAQVLFCMRKTVQFLDLTLFNALRYS